MQNFILNPRTIAVIGASRDKNSVGYGILKNLISGGVFHSEYCRPFQGKVYAVNPNADWILNVKCQPNIKNINDEIDLAIICVPAKIVLQIIKDCVKKKVKAAIIISSGFSEDGEEGIKLQEKILEAAEGKMRLVGPNCLGIITNKMNASFAPSMPPPGDIAFLTQSGALADSIIDWAITEKYGLSSVISLGNQADVDVSDFIELLAEDENTKVIALYIEDIEDGEKFMKIAAKVNKTKPIVVLKAGRAEKGLKAANSHTGRLATSYNVYEAAFRQCGLEIAESIEELFDIAKALAKQKSCKGNIAIITNGGGVGVLCADYCQEFGINLVELEKSTTKKLDKTGLMHPAYSRRNPLDIIGDALPERYEAAINTLLEEKYIDGLIIIQTLQTMTNPERNARVVIDTHQKFPDKPIICCFMGGENVRKGANLLEASNIPNYQDPKKAARAMQILIKRYKKTQ